MALAAREGLLVVVELQVGCEPGAQRCGIVGIEAGEEGAIESGNGGDQRIEHYRVGRSWFGFSVLLLLTSGEKGGWQESRAGCVGAFRPRAPIDRHAHAFAPSLFCTRHCAGSV